MKTVGIIGGLGPESTLEYYRLLIESYRERALDDSYPSIIINSINLTEAIRLVTANELEALASYLAEEVGRLARAGADFAALSANTPHIVFNEVSRRSYIPLISIVEAACEAAGRLGLERVGLFGTRFTMNAGFYQEVFDKEAITLVIPRKEEQDFIHERYMNELVRGIFLTETRAQLLSIIRRLKDEEGIQALVLGGTELPLILRAEDAEDAGIPFLDTTRIHVAAIIDRLLQ